ncbi:MAG: dihydropteroate synthase [Prevotella sp.]|nr:dihydropteroate synthase [Prevotella sp.]
MDYTLNCNGRLMDLSEPQVMGIVNLTPDSFYAASRKQTEMEIVARCHQILLEGASIIDVGACSTRPGGELVSEEEEMERQRKGLRIIRKELPDAVLSIDTFRPRVAQMCIEEYGADIINDVEGSDEMFQTVSRLRIPYVYMTRKASVHDMLIDFAQIVQRLRDLGQKDIILDPGFGFGKTLEQNFLLLNELDKLLVMELPLLVGMSRKRMVWQTLKVTPDESLNGTTVLNTIALQKGASILRVHDVKEAVEVVKIVSNLKQ